MLSRASAPRNARCGSVPAKPADTSDNARSVAFVLTYGAFDFFDAGDLTWNTEAELVCPNMNVPKVEVYQVTHHGLDTSNHPLLLEALAPTVAVMNNGAKKGGSAATVKTLKSLSSLKALYQLHRNVATGPDDNTSPELVANPDESPDAGHMVSVHAKKDGSFEVVNHRTGEKRSFSHADALEAARRSEPCATRRTTGTCRPRVRFRSEIDGDRILEFVGILDGLTQRGPELREGRRRHSTWLFQSCASTGYGGSVVRSTTACAVPTATPPSITARSAISSLYVAAEADTWSKSSCRPMKFGPLTFQ